VLADVIARYHRFKGEKVFYLTGVDQHGQKMQQSAARLMLWSSFRTAIFTLIGVLALVVMRRRLMSTESRSAVDLTKR
jgi:tRNA synthetases class I (M)